MGRGLYLLTDIFFFANGVNRTTVTDTGSNEWHLPVRGICE